MASLQGSEKVLRSIDWGRLAPLRLRARTVAEGVYAGQHRSKRRGPGVEFGGHRAYVPGDDLRWIDRHALMRHDRLIVREFETETERGLHLLMDATASMGFRGASAPGAKVAFAALIAAALAHVALSGRDPVSLDWVGGQGAQPVASTAGHDAFDRIVHMLSSIQATGELLQQEQAFDRAIQSVLRRARRGALIVFLSDLLDLPAQAPAQLAALSSGGRKVVAVQVLDPEELTLPYSGTVRLRAMESSMVVETDADASRAAYQTALAELTSTWAQPLQRHGGQLLQTPSNADPVDVVRKVLLALAQGAT